jgi:hypothetical protein
VGEDQETQRRLLWGKIRNLLKKSAGHSDACRDSRDGLYTEEQLRALPHVEKETAGGTMMPDLQRLIEKYKKEIAQLEAHVEEVKRKHDILAEASRLLQEAALAPHRTLYENLSSTSQYKD